MRIIRCIAIIALSAVLSIASICYGADVVDGPIARKKLERDVKDLLANGKFGELEDLAKNLRETKARFPEGHWKLYYFYCGAATPKDSSEDSWKRWLERFEKWQQKYPNSVTARVAAADAWMTYGWKARGGGFAYTVTAEGWKALSEATAKAVELVNMVPLNAADDCPHRYHLLLVIGKINGWDRDTYFAIFQKAIRFEPEYHSYYATTMIYLTPKWGGEKDEWLSFIRKADNLAGKGDSREIYTRMAGGMWQSEWKKFDDSTVSWSFMKQGHREMERRFPGSPYNLNNFAKYACIAGDKDTLRDLLGRINGRPYLSTWGETNQADFYLKCNEQAFGTGTSVAARTKPAFPNGTEDYWQQLSFARDGDAESQYQVAFMLERGDLVTKNLTEAEKWFLKASGQGHREAQTSLAMMYFNGWAPIARDLQKAAQWYYIAAVQGSSNAASALGHMYNIGFGLEKNIVKAYVWYSQVTQWTDPKVKELAAKMTASQRAEADAETRKFKEQIRANKVKLEMGYLDPSKISVPKMKFGL